MFQNEYKMLSPFTLYSGDIVYPYFTIFLSWCVIHREHCAMKSRVEESCVFK